MDTLTDIERDILDHFADGFSAKEIAKLRDRSYKTIEYHAGKILKKLNAITMTHAVAIAYKTGILRIDE